MASLIRIDTALKAPALATAMNGTVYGDNVGLAGIVGGGEKTEIVLNTHFSKCAPHSRGKGFSAFNDLPQTDCRSARHDGCRGVRLCTLW
jgi:hypothetical protein